MAKTAVRTTRASARKPAAKAPKAKKWVYLFNEVAAAEKYAGSWDGVRAPVSYTHLTLPTSDLV